MSWYINPSKMTDELRDMCIQKYGENFAVIYDGIRNGGAIMDMYESRMFMIAIEETRMEMEGKRRKDDSLARRIKSAIRRLFGVGDR